MSQAFSAAIHAAALPNTQKASIGILSEKVLHAVIKHYVEPNPTFHEVKTGRFVADVHNQDFIYEIQTRGFQKLRAKLDAFLPDHQVVIVYPIAHTKWLYWIHPDIGEISKKRKSPKTGSFYEAFHELYKIKPYLTHPNLHILLLRIDIEEYRLLNGYSTDKKKGSSRYDRIPTALIDLLYLEQAQDYAALLPHTLPTPFTSKDYAKAAKLTLSKAQTALQILYMQKIVLRTGKQGNSILYESTERSENI